MADLLLTHLPLFVDLQDRLHRFHMEYEERQPNNRVMANVVVRELQTTASGEMSLVSRTEPELPYTGAHYWTERHYVSRTEKIAESFFRELKDNNYLNRPVANLS